MLSAVAAIGTLYTGRGDSGAPSIIRRHPAQPLTPAPPGHTTTAFVVCYALTSSVAGFVSGSLYKRSRGASWIRCLVLTCTIMPVPVVAVALALNFVAIAYKCPPSSLRLFAATTRECCRVTLRPAGASPPFPLAL